MTGVSFAGEAWVILLGHPQGVVWLPLFSWNSINRLECNQPLPTQPLPSTSTKSINTDVTYDVILVTLRLAEVCSYTKFAFYVHRTYGIPDTTFRQHRNLWVCTRFGPLSCPNICSYWSGRYLTVRWFKVSLPHWHIVWQPILCVWRYIDPVYVSLLHVS
jgi:hypothetical protein